MLGLLLALAVQAPAPSALLPVTRGTTRSGVAVAVVSAPQSPWAVAQLHLRLEAGELTPKARAATTAWSAVIAEAARKSVGATGTIESRLTPDSLVLSFGVEAARVDDAIRAIDAVLRARSNRPPAAPVPAQPVLSVVDDAVDALNARSLFPGQPIALPLDGGVLDAASAKALGDAVIPERLAVIVVGPDAGDALLLRVNRALTAPLPRPRPVVAPPSTVPTTPAAPTQATIHERSGPKSWSSLTSLMTPCQNCAGVLVLASLLGGHLVRSSVAVGVVVDVVAVDASGLASAENSALEQIRRVAAAPPPPEVVEVARDRVLRSRLSSLNDPARVAHALGQALLDGTPTRVEDEVASLEVLTPAQVSAAAAAVAQGAVVTTRTSGPEALIVAKPIKQPAASPPKHP